MVNIFSHYVPGRLIALTVLEALVLLLAAYVGISLHVAGFGVTGGGVAIPSQVFAFAIGMMIVLSSMGLYQPDLWNGGHSVGVRLAAAFVLGFVVIFLVAHFIPWLNPGIAALGGSLVVALAGSVLVRFAFHKWSNAGILKSRVLVLGTGSRVAKLAEIARNNANFRIVGYLAMQPANHYVPAAHMLSMAPEDTLLSVVSRNAIDQIVVAVRDRRGGGLPVQQLLECKMAGIKVVEMPTFFERECRQVMLDSLNPSWVVLGDGFRQGYCGNIVKRIFDLTASGLLLLFAFPVIVVAALLVFLEDGLPVLYRQERVGQGGRVFTLYKLRSMRMDAERDGFPRWANVNDDRTTRVGRFIRKWRIDELPQIINVFRGDMSFVGPRPERPVFVDQLTKKIPFYSLRHSAKPGITGWAQIRYQYGASVDDAIEKLQHDLYYVKNHCLFLDITILIATVEVVLWGKGAR